MSNAIFETGQGELQLFSVQPRSAGSSSAVTDLMGGPLPTAYQLVSVQANCAVVAAGGSATFNIAKLTGSQLVGSATPMLTTPINCVGSADTQLNGTLIGSQTVQQLAAGDRLVIQKASTWPITAFVAITCVLRRI